MAPPTNEELENAPKLTPVRLQSSILFIPNSFLARIETIDSSRFQEQVGRSAVA